MSAGPELRTERLLLRRWRTSDLEPCAAMNADPRVMENFPAALSRRESDAFIERMEACFEDCGYGLWALELPGEASFIGCVGLLAVGNELPFAPAVEVGWRLAPAHWGTGLAAEAASAAIAFAFDRLRLRELVAYTAERNVRSRRLMDRLGMSHDPAEDFAHPGLPVGHPLAPHVLYRLGSSP
ncbi:MAG TPA: GNAT family N-acetyltransferase [Solirubrobacteraceae bacterium]|nr:GNAT family N-acetyltransferase [Solirubrobacteraceae bacterium]